MAHRRQVNVLRAKARLPTRDELAESVARDVNRFLVRSRVTVPASRCSRPTQEKERQTGNPVRYNCRELTASNVVLLGVQQVSQGSLQPELGIHMHRLYGIIVVERVPTPLMVPTLAL